MAIYYVGSENWTAITPWAATTAYSIGDIRRQLGAVTNSSARAFRCTTAGTSGGAEPSWNLGDGATTADGTVVWTEVTGDEAYGWTAAHATLETAQARFIAGDIAYVANTHNETNATGAYSLALPGTPGSPNQIICVKDNATPPVETATTAVVNAGANNYTFSGSCYVQGVTFQTTSTNATAAMNFNSAVFVQWVFENCVLRLSGSGAGSTWGDQTSLTDSILFTLINTSFDYGGNNTHVMQVRGRFNWRNTATPFITNVPDNVFVPLAGFPVDLYIDGVDFSGMGSAANLLSAALATADCPNNYNFENCKLSSTAEIFASDSFPVGIGSSHIRLTNCGIGDTNYEYVKRNSVGTIYHETTIVRQGGATDGTTQLSRKMVSGSVANFRFSPLESDPIIVWNDEAGAALTATVEIVNDGSTLTDNEIWLEVEYLGTSGSPRSTRTSDRISSVVGNAANQTTSTATWTTTGLSSPVKQQLSVSFTPQEKGVVKGRVILGKASTTVYFDPVLTLA